MSVLICDSNCELWYTRAKELGLDYISMPYTIDGQEYYYDLGEKTDFKDFYDRVRKGSVPITSALNPENYKEILEPYFAKGEDILYISFSHAMSGTFNQLNTALKELHEKYPERKCTVFDTNSISLGAGIQVEQAAILKQKGASDEEIINYLKDFTNKVAVYFVVDDLMHLKRGGRLSARGGICRHVAGTQTYVDIQCKGRIGCNCQNQRKEKGYTHNGRQGNQRTCRHRQARISCRRGLSRRRGSSGTNDKRKASRSKDCPSGGRSRNRNALRSGNNGRDFCRGKASHTSCAGQGLKLWQ